MARPWTGCGEEGGTAMFIWCPRLFTLQPATTGSSRQARQSNPFPEGNGAPRPQSRNGVDSRLMPHDHALALLPAETTEDGAQPDGSSRQARASRLPLPVLRSPVTTAGVAGAGGSLRAVAPTGATSVVQEGVQVKKALGRIPCRCRSCRPAHVVPRLRQATPDELTANLRARPGVPE